MVDNINENDKNVSDKIVDTEAFRKVGCVWKIVADKKIEKFVWCPLCKKHGIFFLTELQMEALKVKPHDRNDDNKICECLELESVPVQAYYDAKAAVEKRKSGNVNKSLEKKGYSDALVAIVWKICEEESKLEESKKIVEKTEKYSNYENSKSRKDKKTIVDLNVEEVSEEQMYKEKEIAEEILKNGPMEFVLKVASKFHYGDNVEKKVLYYSALSMKVINSIGSHINAAGKFGIGKSHIQRTMAHILPQEIVIIATVSAKAIFYNEIEDGKIIVADDYQPTTEEKSVIKRTTTSFHEKIRLLSVIPSHGEGINLTTPSEIVWWLNHNDISTDSAFNSRFWMFNQDESEDKMKETKKFMIEELFKKGLPNFFEDKDVRICRWIFELLPKASVILPFNIEKYDDGLSLRDLNLMSDVVKCSALLNYLNREHNQINESCTIIASEDDIIEATNIWNYFSKFNTSKSGKLSSGEIEIYELLSSNKEGLYVGDIVNKVGKSYASVSRTLKNLQEKRSDIDSHKETVYLDDKKRACQKIRYYIMVDRYNYVLKCEKCEFMVEYEKYSELEIKIVIDDINKVRSHENVDDKECDGLLSIWKKTN